MKKHLKLRKHAFINIYKFLRLVPSYQAWQTSRLFQSVKLIHGTLENTCVKCSSRGSPRGTQMPSPREVILYLFQTCDSGLCMQPKIPYEQENWLFISSVLLFFQFLILILHLRIAELLQVG